MPYSIELTQGYEAFVDREDVDLVSQYVWYYNKGYARTTIRKADGSRGSISMHRLIMGFPRGEVDHIDGNGLNNCQSNLRVATSSQNKGNTPAHYDRLLPGAKGVRRTGSGMYEARIYMNKKEISLGSFGTIEAATEAYQKAVRRKYGEFNCVR